MESLTTSAGTNNTDPWSDLQPAEGCPVSSSSSQPRPACYTRKKTHKSQVQDAVFPEDDGVEYNRVSLDAVKQTSWNRDLSTRGRTSIAVAACVINQPGQKKLRRKAKPALPKPKPKGNVPQPLNFEKEKLYFEEVDAFELLEESPSPNKNNTWASGNQSDIAIPPLSLRLEKWLMSKKLDFSSEPSTTLTKILESPATQLGLISETSPKVSSRTDWNEHLIVRNFSSNIRNVVEGQNDLPSKIWAMEDREGEGKSCVDLNAAIDRLSLSTTCDTNNRDQLDPFSALLAVCGQSSPVKLLDVFCNYCEPRRITKLGEGTFGEVFKAGNFVCKIVPIDGELQVNGEVQKKSEELLEEVVLSLTLNKLRVGNGDPRNACITFVETREVKVCQGPYDAVLVKAWEDWNGDTENDNPVMFPETQCYVIFVLEHGGKDLEKFGLLNFEEAKSLLVQVTMALAVAEAAYEFEHRDLHWGNILLTRNESALLNFTLDGKSIDVVTHGLFVLIIDFTLSRINTGKDILFLDLSADPLLFQGPKGDRQAETYRKMKRVTSDYWEGSFPKTNVLWLMYLVDMLLVKKSYKRSTNDERQLRSFKKQLDQYGSAKEAISDPFFEGMVTESSGLCDDR
ncbi:hypothetical protein MLD38_028764 [Melastoma candidum]|nr:hypothetical protein MLD38_028764 [Melastoma candidum]